MSFQPRKRSLSQLTTLQIGGWTNRFYEVHTPLQLETFLHEIDDPSRVVVLGRGSNILFPGGDFSRPVLAFGRKFQYSEFEGRTVRAGTSVFFPELALEAARRGLKGLEWAAGVPGSVGGAVAMNAGAFDSEVREVLDSVRFVDFEGQQHRRSSERIDFDYRYCELRDRSFVVEAEFELERGDSAEILDRTKRLLRTRRKTQPVGRRSAGCVFKNLNGTSAGELIDRAGLKGTSIGDVQVSERHANYFINNGEGTSRDMLNLIHRVREVVLDQFGYELETELRIIRDD